MNKLFFLIWGAVLLNWTKAYTQDIFHYHKSSMYSIMLKHENQEYCDELVSCFNSIPIPEKFNNHNLSKRIFKAGIQEENDTSDSANQKCHIDALLKQNAIGRRLVAKWFNHSRTGTFNPNLLLERGYYNVSADDVALAIKTFKTQQGVLYDAGEELIGHTYVLVNDIRYGDKRNNKEKRMSAAIGVGIALSAIPVVGNLAMAGAGLLANDFSGFNVTVTSYLYKLNWSEEIANGFYNLYYTQTPDENMYVAFNNEKDLFTLDYIGSYTVHSSNSNFKGVNDRETQIRLVCTRAIDRAISQLQKQHPQFRVRTPLSSISPITAKIGLREDVNENSKFEVLEVKENSDGRTTYKRVAVIKPRKGFVWDNRFLAEFEDDYNANVKATEFELLSGSIPHSGLLIREID